jgi:hypothetical protein
MSIGLYGYTMEIVRRRDSIVRVSASCHARPQISPERRYERLFVLNISPMRRSVNNELAAES